MSSKEKRRVRVPATLRAAAMDALAALSNAEEDGLDYGDAIQVDALYGGRTGNAPDEFEFTFFATSDGQEKWEFTITHDGLRDVCTGQVEELELWCCVAAYCNNKFRRRTDLCHRCFGGNSVGRPANRRDWLTQLAEQSLTPLDFVIGYIRVEDEPPADARDVVGDFMITVAAKERFGAMTVEMAEALLVQAREFIEGGA